MAQPETPDSTSSNAPVFSASRWLSGRWKRLRLPLDRWLMERALRRWGVDLPVVERLWRRHEVDALSERAAGALAYVALLNEDDKQLEAILNAGFRIPHRCTWPSMSTLYYRGLLEDVRTKKSLQLLLAHGIIPTEENVCTWVRHRNSEVLGAALGAHPYLTPNLAVTIRDLAGSLGTFGDQEIPILKTLLDHGADPNAADPGGVPPLHWAAAYASEAVTILLLQAGARPDGLTQDGETVASFVKRVRNTSEHPTHPLQDDPSKRAVTGVLEAGSLAQSLPTTHPEAPRRRRL